QSRRTIALPPSAFYIYKKPAPIHKILANTPPPNCYAGMKKESWYIRITHRSRETRLDEMIHLLETRDRWRD
ncbi:MAG: hypothetical protein Q9194_002298, partial [Teloschistes cf. exilis]